MSTGGAGSYPTAGNTPAGPGLSYYLYGNPAGCSTYPAGWGAVGPYLMGILANVGGTSFTYAASACATASPVAAGDVNILNFDTSIAIYQDDIYWGDSAYPPPPADLIEPVGYCENSSKQQGTDVGLDILVYSKSGQALAVLNQGQFMNGTFQKYSTSPVSVTVTENAGSVQVQAEGLSLQITRNGSKATSGSIGAVVNGETIALQVTCWLSTP